LIYGRCFNHGQAQDLYDFMKAIGQSEAFFGNSDQHISADCDPDLRLDRVLGRTEKCLDSQVLFDPLEEQFDLPALAIQPCNQFGLERKVVGQKRNAFAGFVFGHHAAQRDGIVLAGIENRQYTGLIANDVRLGAIYWAGVAALELGVGLGSDYKESIGLMNGEQPLEIEVAPIEQIISARLDDQLIQDVDFVRLAVADMNINVGMAQRKSSKVCSLIAALCARNGAHG